MENWRLDRLSRVDRSVLRLAITELLFLEDVPPKVAVQEGVRLAGQYGGDDSPRFVNGVLDAVLRSSEATS
jgi:N utilization substance protein B